MLIADHLFTHNYMRSLLNIISDLFVDPDAVGGWGSNSHHNVLVYALLVS